MNCDHKATLIVAKLSGMVVAARKTVMTPRRIDFVHKLLASRGPAQEVALTIGVSVATLYRHLPAPVQETISAEGGKA